MRRAALAHDDRAAGDEFAGKGLYAQPLCIGVASVCGAASTLLMCHCRIPFFIFQSPFFGIHHAELPMKNSADLDLRLRR